MSTDKREFTRIENLSIADYVEKRDSEGVTLKLVQDFPRKRTVRVRVPWFIVYRLRVAFINAATNTANDMREKADRILKNGGAS